MTALTRQVAAEDWLHDQIIALGSHDNYRASLADAIPATRSPGWEVVQPVPRTGWTMSSTWSTTVSMTTGQSIEPFACRGIKRRWSLVRHTTDGGSIRRFRSQYPKCRRIAERHGHGVTDPLGE